MADCATGTPSTASLYLDYVRPAFDEFDELAGDRAYADDKAIVGGIARLDGRPVMIIGHQKVVKPKKNSP